MTHPVLSALGLTDNESGTYLGRGEWSGMRDAGVIEPINPSTGEILARVQASSQADYDICIWKPSPKTPLSAIASLKICNEALQAGGFPDIFFLFNDAGTELAQSFVDDKRIPLISFTGSTHVGRQVGERVAQRLGRSLLELGGNNAIIVDETADMKLAIPAIVFGAVGTAGQRCTTTRRVFVHENIFEPLLETLVKAYRQVESRIGDPTLATTLMGPLNSDAAVQQFLAAIAKARAAGGVVRTGGAAVDGPGNFVLPTIITGLANDAGVV